MTSAACPQCDRDIKVKGRRLGERVRCPFCRANLAIASLKPLELDWSDNVFASNPDHKGRDQALRHARVGAKHDDFQE